MTLRVTYTGTRDQLIEHLADEAKSHRELAKATSGTEKPRQAGIAEGLDRAAEVLGQWDGEAQPEQPNGHTPATATARPFSPAGS